MKLIIDATPLDLYPMGREGFSGGTELYIRQLAAGLAKKGHIVHVICSDLTEMEMRSDRLFYWGKNNQPTTADAIVMVHNLERLGPYTSDVLVLASNGLGADLGPNDDFCTGLDAVATFSECHTELLIQAHPKIRREICHVTGLGVDPEDYKVQKGYNKCPCRLLFANDPQRGLWHVLDIFELVQKSIPDATLHISYDFDRSFNNIRWGASHLAETIWQCKERIEANDAITNLGALSREQVIREQLECSVHVMPSDPPNIGSQIHGISQMECAAAGAALVLSDTEAFTEVFGEAAEILPLPGWFDPRAERRYDCQDWAEIVVDIMRDPARWEEMSRKSRALAEKNTWSRVVDRFEAMLLSLVKQEVAA